MRTHRWLKALAFGCCLGAGADAAFAQAPFMGGGEGSWVTADGSPARAPQMPGMFQPPYPTNDPGVMYPPQTPPGFAPYPGMSPYGMGNYAQDMHYNQGGNWFRQILTKRRDYYFDVNVQGTTTKSPGDALIGAPTQKLNSAYDGLDGFPLPTYGVAATPGTGTGGGGGGATSTQPLGRAYVDDGVIPYVFMTQPNGAPLATIDNRLFPIRSTKIFGEFKSVGTQLNFGFDDEDGSGFKASAWWGFSDHQTFQRGFDEINGVPITQAMVLNQFGNFLFSKNGAVSFDTRIRVDIVGNDIDDPGNFGGHVGTQKYDILYRASMTSQSGGGDMQFYLPSLIGPTSAISLRPVYGGKYMYLGETFDFRGIDSGFSYDVDGGATGGGGGGGGNNQAPTFRPDGDLLDDVGLFEELFETQVNSRVRSHLAGPTAGLRYDFGNSRNFKIWGQSSFGLMANHEEVRVNGFNAGETVVTRFLTGTNMLDGDSTFSDNQTHTHVSPLFEQTFMAESRILKSLPFIKEIPMLAEANLKLGYTQTFVGNVARPANSIQWNGFPRAPKVDIDYQSWYIGRMNLGLEWTY